MRKYILEVNKSFIFEVDSESLDNARKKLHYDLDAVPVEESYDDNAFLNAKLLQAEDCNHTQMEEVAEDKDSGILSGYRHCLDCNYVEWYSDDEEPCEPEE